jgi:hypothetical protein
MNASMYYQISFFTECLITYCTVIMAIAALHITGISAFCTVYVKLFILSTLLKTQSLSVRIYSEKGNHFYNNVNIK